MGEFPALTGEADVPGRLESIYDMHTDYLRRISDLLDRTEYASVATVSDDGRPWNTPVYFARNRESLFWISMRDARHSTNIRHNGRAFIVLFDSSREDTSGAGVYVEATVSELTDEEDIRDGLQIIYRRRNKPVPSTAQFLGDSPHRVYHATAVRAWTNVVHDTSEVPWDERVEIRLP
jgi:nitroimidazol reductase NimA-like FMN-containing flavoprotein (pyridoxamine 5'-phosphate oxidase superfamily)